MRTTAGRRIELGGFGSGPPPRDLLLILAVVFATYSATFFTALLDWLRLTPLVWQRGMVWQLFTYPFVGVPDAVATPWILLELLILYWFGGEVYRTLGRRPFWELLTVTVLGAALVAVLVDLALRLGGGLGSGLPLLQGQRTLLVVFIAAFAVLRANATILLFFVLPVKAAYFLWIELAFAFIAFLGTKDLAGFLGICTAIGLTVGLLRPGGIRRALREPRLRFERWWIERKLGRMRRKSRLHLIRPDDERGGSNGGSNGGSKGSGSGPWVH